MLASSPMRPLPLDDMHLRHWALPVPVSASHFQAATVCLSRHHAPPVVFNVENDAATEQAEVRWPPPDSRAADAWNNSIDTTGAGACACSALLLPRYQDSARGRTTTSARRGVVRMIWRTAIASKCRELMLEMSERFGSGCSRRSSRRVEGIVTCQRLLASWASLLDSSFSPTYWNRRDLERTSHA